MPVAVPYPVFFVMIRSLVRLSLRSLNSIHLDTQLENHPGHVGGGEAGGIHQRLRTHIDDTSDRVVDSTAGDQLEETPVLPVVPPPVVPPAVEPPAVEEGGAGVVVVNGVDCEYRYPACVRAHAANPGRSRCRRAGIAVHSGYSHDMQRRQAILEYSRGECALPDFLGEA
jgi:hypothetical protein